MRIIKLGIAGLAAVLLLVSCSVDFTGNGGDSNARAIVAPTPMMTMSVTTPPPITPSPLPPSYVQEIFSINLLLCEWIGWKPIIDANRGIGSRPGDDSLYERLGLPINIDVRQYSELTAEAIANFFYTGTFNAIGMSVEQFASVYYVLYGRGFDVKMIYSPGYFSCWGDGNENSLTIMGVVISACLLSEPRLVNSFVMGALRATFNYTYTLDGDSKLLRNPDFSHIRSLDAYKYTSDEDLSKRLSNVSFYDRRHNLMALHTRNIAENIFYAAWTNMHGSAFPMPHREDLFDITPLQAVPLLAGYTFDGNVVETVDIVVYFERDSYEIRETPEFRMDIDAVINVLNHRSELNLIIYGFASLYYGVEFTEEELAMNRAKSVMEQLVAGGIDESRLTPVMGGDLRVHRGEDRGQNRIVRIEYVR